MLNRHSMNYGVRETSVDNADYQVVNTIYVPRQPPERPSDTSAFHARIKK